MAKKTLSHINVIQIIVNAIAWLLVAPTLDVLIYSEPASLVYTQGVLAAASNAISTGLIGTLLLLAYSKTRTKEGSLSKR